MRFAMWCFAVLLSLSLFAQEKGSPGLDKPSAPELTAEGYRDLIVKTFDAKSVIETFGQLKPATRSEYVNGRQCIATFTFSESAVADRRKAWANVRVPAALKASHEGILEWIEKGEPIARKMPACYESIFQASTDQLAFDSFLGSYGPLREGAAIALARMGVTLPPIEKKRQRRK